MIAVPEEEACWRQNIRHARPRYSRSCEFVKLILIGFALAAPLAGFVMGMFLQEFAYRIQLGPVIFLTALAFTFLIALGTVGLRAFKAACANPVQSLRSE